MPQPDSSRQRVQQRHWNDSATWPIDPASPRHASRLAGRSTPRSKEEPEKDARTPDDRDGNEELEREQREGEPPKRDRERETHQARAEDLESEDTGQWVATERFTLDELDDTLPNVPRYTDD